jgi:hypothetical protein
LGFSSTRFDAVFRVGLNLRMRSRALGGYGWLQKRKDRANYLLRKSHIVVTHRDVDKILAVREPVQQEIRAKMPERWVCGEMGLMSG